MATCRLDLRTNGHQRTNVREGSQSWRDSYQEIELWKSRKACEYLGPYNSIIQINATKLPTHNEHLPLFCRVSLHVGFDLPRQQYKPLKYPNLRLITRYLVLSTPFNWKSRGVVGCALPGQQNLTPDPQPQRIE